MGRLPRRAASVAPQVSLLSTIVFSLIMSSCAKTHSLDIPSSITPEDHNHHRISTHDQQGRAFEEAEAVLTHREFESYDSSYLRVDRGIIGRQAAEIEPLTNNVPGRLEITPGSTQNWVFPKEAIFGSKSSGSQKRENEEDQQPDELESEGDIIEGTGLKRRQDPAQGKFWVTLTTCAQPLSNDTAAPTLEAPQLQLLISTTASNQKPGSGAEGPQTVVRVKEGYANATVFATSDVFIGVSAINDSNAASLGGSYSYEIAASTDAPYHSIGEDSLDPNLFLVDSDSNSSLLITHNVTQPDGSTPKTNPYVVFAYNWNDTRMNGLKRSYCAHRDLAPIGPNKNNSLKSSVTFRGPNFLGSKFQGNKIPSGQFYLTNLNRSSLYSATLARPPATGRGVIGGGGKIWQRTAFSTKTGESDPRLDRRLPSPAHADECLQRTIAN
jgi:calcium channel MID1